MTTTLRIVTRYRANASGAGRIIATGKGRQATVPYAHELGTQGNHYAAAIVLATRILGEGVAFLAEESRTETIESGRVWAVSIIEADDADSVEDDAEERCPACGEFASYCQGHGEIGDPAGHAVLAAHDDGDHTGCSDLAECAVSVTAAQLDEITGAYVASLLWSSSVATDDSHDGSSMTEADNYEASTDLAESAATDVRLFVSAIGTDLADYLNTQTTGQMGHDFALTRNHHGAGFWDRGLGELGERLTTAAQAMGEVDLYLNADGEISAN